MSYFQLLDNYIYNSCPSHFFGRDTIYQIENNEIEVELGQHYESKSFKRTKVQFVLDARIGGRGVHAMFFRKLR